MDYFHYCDKKYPEGEREGKRKQPPCRDPPHVKIPARNLGEKIYVAAVELGRKELSCQDPSLDNAYHKFVTKQHVEMCEYAKSNLDHFCKTCGLNLKYTQHLASSYQYEALILSDEDCKICKSPKGKICDADKHWEYHREICVKQNIY